MKTDIIILLVLTCVASTFCAGITVCGGSNIVFPCENGGACASGWTFMQCGSPNGTMEVIQPEGSCGLTLQQQTTVGAAVGAAGAAALAIGLGVGLGLGLQRTRLKNAKKEMELLSRT